MLISLAVSPWNLRTSEKLLTFVVFRYTGIDMAQSPLDEPFSSSTLKGGAGIESVLNAFEASTESTELWTPRRLGLRMALAGLYPCPVGSDTNRGRFRRMD